MNAVQAYLDKAADMRGKILDDFHQGLHKLTMEYGIPVPVACRELVNLRSIIDEDFAKDHEKRHAIFRRMVRVYRDPYAEGSIQDGHSTGLGYTTWKVRVGFIRINYTVEGNMPIIERTKARDKAYKSLTKRRGGH